MTNKFTDMRDILVAYALAAEESEAYDDGESDHVTRFAAKVQTMMGMSMSRKIQALCYLLDNQLGAVATVATANNALQHRIHPSENFDDVSKEDAFAALQMAITAQSVNYQNGDNK